MPIPTMRAWEMSPNEERVLAYSNRVVGIWDLRAGMLTHHIAVGEIMSARWLDDDRVGVLAGGIPDELADAARVFLPDLTRSLPWQIRPEDVDRHVAEANAEVTHRAHDLRTGAVTDLPIALAAPVNRSTRTASSSPRPRVTIAAEGLVLYDDSGRDVLARLAPRAIPGDALAVAPNGRWIAVAHPGEPRLLSMWDRTTSTVTVRELPSGARAHLSWGPGADQLVVAVDRTLWLVPPDEPAAAPRSIHLGAEARSVDISASDGRQIVVGHAAGITLFDQVGGETRTVRAAGLLAVALSPDARRVYLVGPDHITAWNMETFQPAWRHEVREAYRPVDVTGEGPLVFARSGKELRLDPESGHPVANWLSPAPGDGRPWLLVPPWGRPGEPHRAGTVLPPKARPPLDLAEDVLWGATGVQLHGPRGVFDLTIPDDLWSAARFPDHRRMVTLTAGGTVQSWATDTGELRFSGALFDLGDRPAGAVVWTADGQWDGDPATIGRAIAFTNGGNWVLPDADEVARARTVGLLALRW